jgi:hypothetical protein
MTFDPTTLLDVPGLDAPFLARLESQVSELLGTDDDVVIVQAEAILAMEARNTATSAGWSEKR